MRMSNLERLPVFNLDRSDSRLRTRYRIRASVGEAMHVCLGDEICKMGIPFTPANPNDIVGA